METSNENIISEIDVSQWELMCRICFTTKGCHKSIFKHDSVDFLKKLTSVSNLKVSEEDGLPSKICSLCLSRVDTCYKFRELCEKSDEVLRRVAQQQMLLLKSSSQNHISKELKKKASSRRKGRPRKGETVLLDKNNWHQEDSFPIKEESGEDLASSHLVLEIDDGESANPKLQEDPDDPSPLQEKLSAPQDAPSDKCSNGDAFVCDLCDKEFRKESTLRAHVRTHHGHGEGAIARLTCDLCGGTFSSKPELMKHMREVHRHPDPGAPGGSRKRRQMRACEFCGKAFDSRIALERHLPKHTGERPHKCDHCGKRFAVLGTLTKHMRTHTGERPFHCAFCPKAFAHSDSLAIHVRTHTGERPYQCAACGKCFSQLPHLKRHSLIHTGEKPFKCLQCSRAFRRSNSLRAHTEQHEWESLLSGEGGVGEVGAATPPLDALERKRRLLLREGKRYKCEVCERTFSQVQLLNCHMRVHTGERPYQCPTCGKTFVQSQHLTRHIRVHTGERPYCCAVCGKTYKQSYELRKHSQAHEQQLPPPSLSPSLPPSLVTHSVPSSLPPSPLPPQPPRLPVSAVSLAVNASLNLGASQFM